MFLTPTNRRFTRFAVNKQLRLLLAALLTFTALSISLTQAQSTSAQANVDRVRTPADRDLFGMVMRDPFYEYNTDPVNFSNAPNKTALEAQAKELDSAGVKWVRMEFF